ncbi:MAG: anaerobic ribonucleoside-triphosphate reductase activating protein [bacterium]
MHIAGLTPLSLIDYPEKLACIVFTQGCNWRCPFCHNPDILEIKSKLNYKQGLSEIDFFKFLETRINKLDGVVITGGEPSLQVDLLTFMQKIKQLGFLIKLDSNGTNPQVLKMIFDQKLADYVAMDIKHTPDKYNLATGRKVDLEKIKESINLIKNSGLDYEFRTTVVPGIHTFEDAVQAAKLVWGSKRYFIQEYRPAVTLEKIPKGVDIDLDKILLAVKSGFEFVGVRR